MRCPLTALGLVVAARCGAGEPLLARLEPPRPFGYVIGDRVPLAAEFTLPNGCEPLPASLPRPGRVDYWLDLRGAELRQPTTGTYRFERVYQTFFAPLEVKTLTLPALDIAYRCGTATNLIRVPAWRFTMAPLRPAAVGKSDDDSYMRPDRAPEPPDLWRSGAPLIGWSVAFVALACMLARLNGWLPGKRRPRPFARAQQALRLLSRAPLTGPSLISAYAELHRAFNTTHGKPLFAAEVDAFIAARPGWSRLRPDIVAFFDASYSVHFGPADAASPSDCPAQRLIELADACRQCEALS